ncbi:MAG: MATE family efflux transporter [Gemmatimonadaceae bacterium]
MTATGAPGAAHVSESQGGVWSALREAVAGSQRDYTTGSISRAVVLLAIPMVLEMSMESIFVVVDMFFVGRLGPYAQATVALTESLITIVYAIAIGLSIGVAAMVARRIGERDPAGAAKAAAQAIWLGLGLAALLGVIGAVYARPLMAAMGADAEVLEKGVGYTRVLLGGNASVLLLFLINAIFRGAGDAAIAMRALWLGNAFNIALGPCFIFGLGPFPELGVMGAAVATTTGRSIGAMYAFSRLFQKGSRVRLDRSHVAPDTAVMWRLIRLSAAGTLQIFIGVASWIGLIRILSTFGSDALAGYAIGVRVILFALLPSWGLSNAAATMVGQSLGARNPDRAEKAVWLAAFYNMCFLVAIGLGFLIFAPQIARLFSTDPEVQRYAVVCLRVVALGFPAYAYGMVITQSFNGAGDTWTPTYLNLFIFWLWEIPLAYILAKTLGLGPYGIFIAIAVAYVSLAVISALLFRRGRWKTKVV